MENTGGAKPEMDILDLLGEVDIANKDDDVMMKDVESKNAVGELDHYYVGNGFDLLGNKDGVDMLQKWLTGRLTPTKSLPKFCILVGPDGVGKTSLVLNLAQSTGWDVELVDHEQQSAGRLNHVHSVGSFGKGRSVLFVLDNLSLRGCKDPRLEMISCAAKSGRSGTYICIWDGANERSCPLIKELGAKAIVISFKKPLKKMLVEHCLQTKPGEMSNQAVGHMVERHEQNTRATMLDLRVRRLCAAFDLEECVRLNLLSNIVHIPETLHESLVMYQSHGGIAKHVKSKHQQRDCSILAAESSTNLASLSAGFRSRQRDGNKLRAAHSVFGPGVVSRVFRCGLYKQTSLTKAVGTGKQANMHSNFTSRVCGMRSRASSPLVEATLAGCSDMFAKAFVDNRVQEQQLVAKSFDAWHCSPDIMPELVVSNLAKSRCAMSALEAMLQELCDK